MSDSIYVFSQKYCPFKDICVCAQFRCDRNSLRETKAMIISIDSSARAPRIVSNASMQTMMRVIQGDVIVGSNIFLLWDTTPIILIPADTVMWN